MFINTKKGIINYVKRTWLIVSIHFLPADFKELTHHVLNSMMGYIALPAILQKIMQDPAYNTGKFGEIRELILGMLETYNYEQVCLLGESLFGILIGVVITPQ